METFGERLRRLRKERGLKLRELAAVAGAEKSMVSRYEHDKRTPDLDKVKAFAALLDVSLDELVLGKQCRTAPRRRRSRAA